MRFIENLRWVLFEDSIRREIMDKLDAASEGKFFLTATALRDVQKEVGWGNELTVERVVERIHELRRKQTKNAA